MQGSPARSVAPAVEVAAGLAQRLWPSELQGHSAARSPGGERVSREGGGKDVEDVNALLGDKQTGVEVEADGPAGKKSRWEVSVAREQGTSNHCLSSASWA